MNRDKINIIESKLKQFKYDNLISIKNGDTLIKKTGGDTNFIIIPRDRYEEILELLKKIK